MKVNSLKVFVRVLLFGLVLGASSTAYGDAIAISSVSFGGLQFTPTSGTALFAPTGPNALARAQNSLDEFDLPPESNTVPVAQATATVTFASASATANTTNRTASAASLTSVSGCTCSASSLGNSSFTGTLVILGGEGNVNVLVSGLVTGMQSAMTDSSGVLAVSNAHFTLNINDVPVFSFDSELSVLGQNGSLQAQARGALSDIITLQFGAVNTVSVIVSASTVGANEVPEPTTVVLLFSGLGFMTGVIRKRRKTLSV